LLTARFWRTQRRPARDDGWRVLAVHEGKILAVAATDPHQAACRQPLVCYLKWQVAMQRESPCPGCAPNSERSAAFQRGTSPAVVRSGLTHHLEFDLAVETLDLAENSMGRYESAMLI
jgi:hypothetical protein